MKHHILTLAMLVLLAAGCYPTRIVTYYPSSKATHYKTVVTPARTRQSTTISQVVTASEDISLDLDLQAVAALFSQSNSVQEFEQLLNSGKYPVSNLDLDGDGYIDYLRVLETVEGYRHAFLIQAVLGNDLYQDVATLIAELPSYSNYSVEIIGAPYIYGPSYIVRPVFIARPPMFDHFLRPRYVPWRSPWHWGHFPPHFRHHHPVYLNHYQAYVRTYLHGHRYCHECIYPPRPFYDRYDRMVHNYRRNDYGSMHPDRAFSNRTANAYGENVKNAYDIRERNESSKITTVTDGRETSKTGRGTGESSTTRIKSSSSSATQSASRSSSSASRSSATAGTAARSSSSQSSASRQTQTESAPSRSASSTSTSRSGSSATSSTSSRSASSASSRSNASRSSSGQTSVHSRVNPSGSASTTVKSSGSSSRSGSSVSRSSSSSNRSSSSSSSSSSRSSSSGRSSSSQPSRGTHR